MRKGGQGGCDFFCSRGRRREGNQDGRGGPDADGRRVAGGPSHRVPHKVV